MIKKSNNILYKQIFKKMWEPEKDWKDTLF